jgi:glycosyltransferase involved in cell wall biosynthesis
VLLTTEGTYPFILGGVSTWCDVLVNGLTDIRWQVLPITAGGVRRTPLYELGQSVEVVSHLELWSESVHPWNPLRRRGDRDDLPAALVEGLLRWRPDSAELGRTLVWCRDHASRVGPSFRSQAAWEGFLLALRSALADRSHDGADVPAFDLQEATELYHTLYWVARSAAHATPEGTDAPDVLLVTAAGWACIPAVVHRLRHDVPLVLSEHGVYVREAYLAAVRSGRPPATRWAATRLARGLSLLCYEHADVVAPVTTANTHWERELGVDERRVRVIHNGVLVPRDVPQAPPGKRVVAIGRIDPLKDILTMLRAAAVVLEQDPEVSFEHFGNVPRGNEAYWEECKALHASLGLGERFEFCGPTDDPFEELVHANVALLTSISEGFPISVLEAMAHGRPVVATRVGGVPEALAGCGYVVAPGDHRALATGILTLAADPALAHQLGERGRVRAARQFGQAACLEGYRTLLSELTGIELRAPVAPEEPTDLRLLPLPAGPVPIRRRGTATGSATSGSRSASASASTSASTSDHTG